MERVGGGWKGGEGEGESEGEGDRGDGQGEGEMGWSGSRNAGPAIVSEAVMSDNIRGRPVKEH